MSRERSELAEKVENRLNSMIYVSASEVELQMGTEVNRKSPYDSGNIDSEIPPLTEWKHICSFMGLDLSYVPALKSYFINHWEISYVIPLMVISIMSSSFVFLLISIRPPVFITPIIAAFFALFIISYVQVILVGPGYIPFYYPLELSTRSDGLTDYLSGLVTTQSQLEFLKKRSPITRTNFFKSVHRVVIRPDHLCGWTTSFIGKKNHKLFFLFNAYGVLYIGLFLFYDIFFVIKEFGGKDIKATLIFGMILMVFGLAFFILCLSFVCSVAYNISTNQTQFEDMKGRPMLKRPVGENWEQIFGNRRYWYLWFCPVSPFQGTNDIELIDCLLGEKAL